MLKKKPPSKIILGLTISLIIINLTLLGYRRNTSPSSKPRPISHKLDTCSVTKEGNPLVETLTAKDEAVQGTFKGKVVDLKYDRVLSAYAIKLASLDNKQSYIFTTVEQKGLISTTKGEASGSALKTDQVLQVSFSCDTKSNGFRYTKVLIN
ncbi:hypothetical protein HYW41_04880 [Candidatus Daviesbacteria bacterium]|nr:hypothetical protein [Candidatus Daviesbacteria bacterium]